jgi:cold shock protein
MRAIQGYGLAKIATKNVLKFFKGQNKSLHLVSYQYKIPIKMQTGTVKFFNDEKGFGFIKEEGSEKEIFVHASGLIDKVTRDDKVEFELKDGKKGPNAINVKKI